MSSGEDSQSDSESNSDSELALLEELAKQTVEKMRSSISTPTVTTMKSTRLRPDSGDKPQGETQCLFLVDKHGDKGLPGQICKTQLTVTEVGEETCQPRDEKSGALDNEKQNCFVSNLKSPEEKEKGKPKERQEAW